MKRLYMIGGTMGIGKTTVCALLKKKLDNCVFLDGDWCWDADPFQVTEETKRMAVQNAIFLLDSFIRCSAYENIVFCWVMHEQEIIDEILMWLNRRKCEVCKVSLVCTPQELENRLRGDIEKGRREPDVVGRSLARLPLYEKLSTVKLDVTALSPEDTAAAILRLDTESLR